MNYWSKRVIVKLQERNGEHKNIRGVLFELAKSGGYVLKPIKLISIFYYWLQGNHKSKMNAQTARNMAETYSVLSHIFYIAGEKNIKQNTFSVSQSVWKSLCIKGTALKNSIKYLQEMNLVKCYNHCVDGKPEQRKRMFIMNRCMLEYHIKMAKQAQEDGVIDDLDFDDWGECKGKKTKIIRSSQSVKENTSELDGYDDFNEMLDDGFYFC